MLLAGMPQKKSVCQAKEKFTTILIGEIDTGVWASVYPTIQFGCREFKSVELPLSISSFLSWCV